jgi:hypothetical protein
MFTILKSIFLRKFKRKVKLYFRKDELNTLRKRILKYYKHLPKNEISYEHNEIINYLKENSLYTYPYSFINKYDYRNVEVLFDTVLKMHFVYWEGKRMYYKKNFTIEQIKASYNLLEIEQDINSPHRYQTSTFFVNENDIVCDIGAAEGNFALSVVDKVKKLYIFEADEDWIEALSATFLPWKDKVVLINKFVSYIDDSKSITLDKFFRTIEPANFIKIDVEGEESNLLKGCETILNENVNLKIALCTYHKHQDAEIFSSLLNSKKFKITFSNGFMIFHLDKDIREPFLRRGLIRASK